MCYNLNTSSVDLINLVGIAVLTSKDMLDAGIEPGSIAWESCYVTFSVNEHHMYVWFRI